jgi:hypothetical protein
MPFWSVKTVDPALAELDDPEPEEDEDDVPPAVIPLDEALDPAPEPADAWRRVRVTGRPGRGTASHKDGAVTGICKL